MATIPTEEGPGRYLKLFQEYTGKTGLLREIRTSFLEGIRLFAGAECREHCESAGLEKMHLYYPAESVGLLEAFVARRLKRRMLEWSAMMGREDLHLGSKFLIQDLLIVRVHYPHVHIGRPSGPARSPRLHQRVRFGLASAIERMRDGYGSMSTLRVSGRIRDYARERRKRAALLLPYRCHAPHLDSWLGQPISSLSVWLAVAGVDSDNSMCLYPETIGARLPLNGSQFLGSGFRLSKPSRPEIRDGDLFVFSTDILHSSQLNVSDNTRIALTTRIDPGTPIFSQESLWFVQRWYRAGEIFSGRWRRSTVRASRNSIPRSEASDGDGDGCIRIASSFRVTEQYVVAPSQAIREGGKLAVQFQDKRVLIVRNKGTLRAYSARCPHGNYHMDDGSHDERALVCPGHGLEFDCRTGRSRLDRYRLAMFRVSEQDGMILLGPSSVESRSSGTS